jgi:capsular polysaccharide export protein
MTGKTSRTVLFLQGPTSLFWTELAAGFEAAGHRVLKVHLCAGDWLFWRRRGALNYRGRFSNWAGWLERLMREEGVTDVLYYADRLPYHVEARRIAERLGISPYAVEFGYLRPDWLTLERGGMGAYSHFPTDPAKIRAAAAGLPAPDTANRYPFRFQQEAFGEVTFHLSAEILRILYPFYRHDTYYHPFLDYLSWIGRLTRVKSGLEHAVAVTERIWNEKQPYHLLALQLQSDYQIRANSAYGHLSEMIDEVISSFAFKAPPGDHLVVKMHPLDNGFENWPKVTERIAADYGIADRVHAIDGGDLMRLIAHAKGTVVVNSTVGLHSVRAGCPTKVLGVAVFDVPGLTHQGPIDSFWTAPEPVDAELCDAFVRVMAAAIQVKGSFYNPEGRRAAVAEIVRRVEAGTVNLPGAFEPVPPRLAKAKAAGVPIVI